MASFPLVARAQEIWPIQAKKILQAKGITHRELEKLFSKVIFPGNLTYDSYRFFFQLEISELPLFVVVFKKYDETSTLLNFLALHKLTVRIVNGRHSSSIQNPNVYADISQLREIKITPNRLYIQGGATQGEVYEHIFSAPVSVSSTTKTTTQTQLHFPGAKISHPILSFALHPRGKELAFIGGTAGSVGVSGIASAAGISTLKRTFGLTTDSVTSFKIAIPPVTLGDMSPSNGSKIVKASETENSDLFWALRGGLASNFGIVVKTTFKIIRLGDTIVYSISFNDWKVANRVMTLWQKTAPKRSRQFNEDLSLFSFTDDKAKQELGIGIGGVYVIPDDQSIEDAKKTVSKELFPFLKFGGKLTLTVSTYQEMVRGLASKRRYRPFSSAKICFKYKPVSSDLVIKKLEETKNLPGLHLFGIELMGGKISDVSSMETAFFPRKSKFFVEIFSYWHSALDTCANIEWTSLIFSEIYVPEKDTVYVGFPINRLPKHLKAYYGNNRHRLRKIKEQIDPLHVLRFPTGIIE
jgi:hypothetical protein